MPDPLEKRLQELEVLTGFQERALAQLQEEVLAFTKRVVLLEDEVRRLRSVRSDEQPFDENDRVPSGG